MKPFSLEQWEQTADYIIPVLIGEPMVDENTNHYWRIIENNIAWYHFPPGRWRDTWRALAALVFNGKPVHITTLGDELNGTVDNHHLAQWYAMYQKGSTLRGHVFEANVETLRRYGETAQIIDRFNHSVDRLMQGEDSVDDIISDTVSGISNVGGQGIVNETAAKMTTDFVQYLSTEPDTSLRSGVQLIDSWTGGFGRGDFLAIAAPMKQRKTSLTLNILINMARAGKSVALMMLESNKRMVNAMLVSMLAMEYVLGNGWYTDVDEDGRTPIRHIWAKALARERKNYRKWGKYRVKAVDYGIAEFRKLGDRIRVYDKTKDGGQLGNMGSIQRVCLRDKALYDTDLIAIDHAQRINEKGSDYEKLTLIVPYLETLARREDVAICLLAQLNASNAEGTGDTHIAGVRGGSVLDEAVDYMFITGYKQKDTASNQRYPNDALLLGLQHSRYGDGGTHKRAHVAIDPNTGLITGGGAGLNEVSLTGGNIDLLGEVVD